MGLPRILFYVVGRVMAALLAGLGLGLDYAGKSIIDLTSGGWGVLGLIAFGVFFLVTLYREVELYLAPYPKVESDGLSPATTPLAPAMRKRYFVRLDFINNATDPSGEASTLNALTASIRVFDRDSKSIDAWDGRWANTDEPHTFGLIWVFNRLELPVNNQRATLDIGFRFEGEQIFTGWDNAHYLRVTPVKVPIKPGFYQL